MVTGPPPPPDPFDPVFETIPAGTVLYRVHEPSYPNGVVNDGTAMNPGYGKRRRFAFFGDPIVPVMYAAYRPEGAVHESILHDAEPGTFIPQMQWRSKILSALTVATAMTVASFHSDGLRRFGLFPADLTDTLPTAYPDTVRWAHAAWLAGAQGVSYMCRHYNTSKAVCLFGDRLPVGTLHPVADHDDARVFALPMDSDWLASLAFAMRATIRP